MTDDIVSELGDLQRQANALQGLVASAQASAPRQAEGSDATGAIWATIGADGLPSSLWVEERWQRRLSPERFGTAVVEAFAAASANRMAAWNDALRDKGWPSTVDEVRRELDRPPHPHVQTPPARTSPTPAVGPRALADLLDDMLGAFEHIDEVTATSPLTAEASGTSGYHKVEVRLSPAGLVSCVVDGQWASQQSADAMMAAFGEAMAQARADLAAKVDAPRNLDRVLGEALALLNDPQRLAS
jgi:hypothetical protein